jgi:hypothetical protein
MKAVPTKDLDPTMDAFTFSDTRPVTVKVESGSKKMASSSNEATKNKDGRYIVTQKVKVDSIKKKSSRGSNTLAYYTRRD